MSPHWVSPLWEARVHEVVCNRENKARRIMKAT